MKKFIKYAARIIFSRTMIVIFMVMIQILVLLVGFTWLGQYMSYIFEGMSLLGAVLIIYIINRNEPSEFKIAWIIPICLFPVFGALIYVFVMGNIGGMGLRARMEQRRKETGHFFKTDLETKKEIDQCTTRFKGFAHYMEKLAGYPVFHRSSAVYYSLGEEKFADMLAELKKAEKYIFLEYFIIEKGIMWEAILEVLKEKAKQGVEVRVMYDGMCSILLLPYRYPKELKQYGIKAKMFAPIMPFLSTNQNNRDHRKILIIDGKVAFTGGVNLADEYINEKEVYGHWKDVAVKINGDAVRSFIVMFLQMWNVSEPEMENCEPYLQDVINDETQPHDGFVIPYGETPTMAAEVGKTVYADIINRADKYVHIMSPYFIVDREFIDTMCYAAQRGVEVAMILPHIPDKKLVFYIARTFYPLLLKAGVKIFEYTPGFVHAKVFVSDDNTAAVGTINLDYRSFYHHFECGAYFYECSVVKEIEKDFHETRQQCQEVDWEYYRRIPVMQKLLGRVGKLFAPLM